MSRGQWRKLDVMERIERGELTASEGAQVLGLSRRQVQRLRKKDRLNGAKGVLHGNAGRAPKHKLAALLRTELVALGAFLAALAEFDRRRLFRDLGYASFFDYEAARSSIAGLSRAVADGSHRVALFGPAGDFTNSEFSQSTIRARQAQGVSSVDGPQSNTRGHRPLR